jgi:hypothetical protein
MKSTILFYISRALLTIYVNGKANKPLGLNPPFPPPCIAKTGKNYLNEEITTLLPTGIGERFNQTILGQAALLIAPM